MKEKEFDEWVSEREKELFRVDKFKAIGKETDYIFQALTFTGEASHNLSLSTTILSNLDEVPGEIKEELKSIQNQLHDFKHKLRKIY